MSEDQNIRREFISRVGTFFIIIGIFAITIFAASDISRNSLNHKTSVTQTFIVESIQAIQTRDAGATKAAIQNRPTPRLIPVPNREAESMLTFIPLFCIGSAGLLIGWFFKRISAVPGKSGSRFEGIRKMLQKQHDDKIKKEKEKADKAKKK